MIKIVVGFPEKKVQKIFFWRKKVQANLTIDFKVAVYNFREIFTQDFIQFLQKYQNLSKTAW